MTRRPMRGWRILSHCNKEEFFTRVRPGEITDYILLRLFQPGGVHEAIMALPPRDTRRNNR